MTYVHITFFCLVKGPAADATDAPQPWGLLCNPVMKIISFFFPCNGASVEWIWQVKTKYSGKNLYQRQLVHHKSHMDWPGIEPGPPYNITFRHKLKETIFWGVYIAVWNIWFWEDLKLFIIFWLNFDMHWIRNYVWKSWKLRQKINP
jgi:hypothetical protein